MSKLWMSGFESSTNATSVTSALMVDGIARGTGTVSRDTTNQRSGASCLKLTGGATTNAYVQAGNGFSGGVIVYIRCYFKFGNLPSASTTILSNAVTNGLAAVITSAGKLQLWNNQTPAKIGSDSVATIGTGTWYRIELAIGSAGGNPNYTELLLDGVSVASSLAPGVISAAPGWAIGLVTNPGVATDLYVDDASENDNQGVSNNTWPGDGKVAILKPTADSAVGSGWTDSGGSATGLFGSVDNTPPTGITDTTASAGHQIRNASSALSNYDATMTTYTAAGVGASDTINAIIGIANTAAPVSTGAKSGALQIVSNPAGSSAAFANGSGTATFFWSGTTAGTFVTGWKWERTAIIAAPTVTLGTAPVMRCAITGGTASRIAMCDAMLIYVDYTPVSSTTYTKSGFGREHA